MLAASDERCFDFTVLRHDADDLAPVGWDVDTAANELTLADVETVRSLTVHTDDTGLDTGSLRTVELTIDADVPTVILLEDYATAPSMVSRDGVCGAPNWSGGVVRLVELQTGTHEWEIVP